MFYVDVALVRRAPHQVSGNPLGSVAEDAAGRHSVSEFLDRRERVVLAVSGPPGSGKSTLLAHAARRSARAGRRSRRRVPVLLALREYAGIIAAGPGTPLPDVLRSAVSGVPGSEPEGWWERQLRRGRCMILLDGLDEVARQEDRGAVATWVERQISSYPGNHFVITSRPHGFPGPVIAHADVLAVRPFTAEQVQLFLNHWYLADSEAGNDRGVLVTCRESSPARRSPPGKMCPDTCQVSRRLPPGKTGPASPNRGNPTAQHPVTGTGLSRLTRANVTGGRSSPNRGSLISSSSRSTRDCSSPTSTTRAASTIPSIVRTRSCSSPPRARR